MKNIYKHFLASTILKFTSLVPLSYEPISYKKRVSPLYFEIQALTFLAFRSAYRGKS